MNKHSSEVARLRARIEQECQAAQRGLHEYASTARHDFIEARMTMMGVCQQRLAEMVGEQEALAIVIEALERASHVEQVTRH